uniref:Uncharacterized protein n=1 Tax=Oryza meridionalis TaxID=40149 RepID=A0A0E0DJQ1_9ORYZ
MRTVYPCESLNTLKKTAVRSRRSPDAMTSSPNGPIPPCTAAPFAPHSASGEVIAYAPFCQFLAGWKWYAVRSRWRAFAGQTGGEEEEEKTRQKWTAMAKTERGNPANAMPEQYSEAAASKTIKQNSRVCNFEKTYKSPSLIHIDGDVAGVHGGEREVTWTPAQPLATSSSLLSQRHLRQLSPRSGSSGEKKSWCVSNSLSLSTCFTPVPAPFADVSSPSVPCSATGKKSGHSRTGTAADECIGAAFRSQRRKSALRYTRAEPAPATSAATTILHRPSRPSHAVVGSRKLLLTTSAGKAMIGLQLGLSHSRRSGSSGFLAKATFCTCTSSASLPRKAGRPPGRTVAEPDQHPLTSNGSVGSIAVPRKAQFTRSPETEWPQESLPVSQSGPCGLYWFLSSQE